MDFVHEPHTVPVISEKAPTEQELKEDEVLHKFMQDAGLYESENEFNHRLEVLQLLAEAVLDWVRAVARSLQLTPEQIEEARANVYSFGSFRLTAHGPGDDIDTHCVGPKWLERTTHFFGAEPTACLEARLRAAAWVTSVRALPDAYVPVLKLDIKGVDIDMTFAQLPLAEVPAQLDLQRNELLAGMDEKSMLSINGCRVTDRLVQLVTDRCGGLRSFQGALRFLKFWGKRRGIYSNVMGFLGGVNFALLVTRVCLHYPHAPAAAIVRRFFKVLDSWPWSECLPFMVTGIDRGGPAMHLVWQPRLDRREVFPIITPCYPASNSTFNVSECTRAILLQEVARGAQLAAAADVKAGEMLDFGELARPLDFLGPGGYNNYLLVMAAASSVEDIKAWAGFINTRIKHLVNALHHSLRQIATARPWPQEIRVPMDSPDCDDGRTRICWVIGIKKAPAPAQQPSSGKTRIDMRQPVSDWTMACQTWAGYRPGMSVVVTTMHVNALPEYLQQLAVSPGSPGTTSAAVQQDDDEAPPVPSSHGGEDVKVEDSVPSAPDQNFKVENSVPEPTRVPAVGGAALSCDVPSESLTPDGAQRTDTATGPEAGARSAAKPVDATNAGPPVSDPVAHLPDVASDVGPKKRKHTGESDGGLDDGAPEKLSRTEREQSTPLVIPVQESA